MFEYFQSGDDFRSRWAFLPSYLHCITVVVVTKTAFNMGPMLVWCGASRFQYQEENVSVCCVPHRQHNNLWLVTCHKYYNYYVFSVSHSCVQTIVSHCPLSEYVFLCFGSHFIRRTYVHAYYIKSIIEGWKMHLWIINVIVVCLFCCIRFAKFHLWMVCTNFCCCVGKYTIWVQAASHNIDSTRMVVCI